ncbi:hypothetical protein LFZ10_21080, partial [Salmonella enterica subsp. enterica serovar Berta str. SA20103550]
AEAILARQGHSATVFEDPELSDWQQYQDKVALVVTSTTGQGDLPDTRRFLSMPQASIISPGARALFYRSDINGRASS